LRISLASALQRRAFRWKLPIRSRQPRLFLAFPCPTPAIESARLGCAPFDVGYTALGNPFMGNFASVMRLGNAPLESPVTALRSLRAVFALPRGAPQSSKARHRPCSSWFSLRINQFLDIRIYFRNFQLAHGGVGWVRNCRPERVILVRSLVVRESHSKMESCLVFARRLRRRLRATFQSRCGQSPN
jgi:hypothetical protein